MHDNKKSKFIKEQKARGLWSSLGMKKPEFLYSACRPFTKNKERMPKFKETGYSQYIYQKKLGKACFQLNMCYRNFKDLTRRTPSDKIVIKHLI